PPVALLVAVRLAETNDAARRSDDDVAGAIEGDRLRALETEADRARIRAGRDDEVVFELPRVAVEDDVDAGVDGFVLDPAVHRHRRHPSLRVVAAEVARGPGQRVDAGDRRPRSGTEQPHPQR